VSQKIYPPPEVFWTFFPKGWEFLIKILHACYSFILTLNCKILFSYPQLWQSYAILSATTQWIFTFHAGLVEGKLYRLHCKGRMVTKFTRLQLTWLQCVGCNASGISQTSPKAKDHSRAKTSALQQIWDDLPQTTINKAVNDFRKRLNKCVSAGGGHFEHTM